MTISVKLSTAAEQISTSEETSAAIEEQTAAMQQVNISVRNVNDLAQKTGTQFLKTSKISFEDQNIPKSVKKSQNFNKKETSRGNKRRI